MLRRRVLILMVVVMMDLDMSTMIEWVDRWWLNASWWMVDFLRRFEKRWEVEILMARHVDEANL